MVVDVQLQPGVALGDPAKLGEMPAGEQPDWQLLLCCFPGLSPGIR
jgi:hypothetical protein